MPLFESRTELPAKPEQVFDFIVRPANLQAIAPPEIQMVFVDPPEVIELGSKLVCRVVAYGQVQELAYEIVEFAPDQRRFREQAVGGPLPKWIHDYQVETSDNDVTVLLNKIEFEPPGGLLGYLVTKEKILDHLDDGFAYRRSAIQKHFS